MSKKKWEISDKVNLVGTVVNSIIAVCTIIALIFTYKSMKVSEESLLLTKQIIKESDSTSNVNLELTKRSVEAAIKLAQSSESSYELSKIAILKSDSNYKKSAYLSQKAFAISEKSFEESVKQFNNSNSPYIQVEDFMLSGINVNQDIYITYSLHNLSDIPVKLMSYRGQNLVENIPLNYKSIVDNIDYDAITNKYLIKGAELEYKVTFYESSITKDKQVIDILNNRDFCFFIEREIKYKSLITNKIRFYRFKVKIKRILGSSFYPNNTYFEVIKNENVDA